MVKALRRPPTVSSSLCRGRCRRPGGRGGPSRAGTIREAEIVRLVDPAAHRVQPACPVAGECGGCALQHLAYPAELAWKEERVRQALVRVGRLANVPVQPILGMDRPHAYRNKAQYPVRKNDGKTVVGFYRRKSHEVVAADDCLIQHPLAVKVAEGRKNSSTTWASLSTMKRATKDLSATLW